MFAALIVTLPTKPNAVRLRIWRALKTLGAAALRDGAYLLPEAHAARFEALVDEVRSHGGTASLWQLSPRDDAQQQELVAQFDRSAAYAEWQTQALELQAEMPKLGESDARRRWRAVNEALQTLHAIDYFPGAAAGQADEALQSLRQALDARFSKGEPMPAAAHALPRLDKARYRGKRWTTRKRPWVDRLACAWLIGRFVDPQARFLWLDDPAGATPPPRGAIGFDFDGAAFTHVGARVTFEVMCASFGLDADPRLQRIARAVHVLDVGGIPVPEAPGLEAVLAGLREVHDDDDLLVAASSAVFDALYAAPGAAE